MQTQLTSLVALTLLLNSAFAEEGGAVCEPSGGQAACSSPENQTKRVYSVAKADCPQSKGYICAPPLPLGSLSCEANPDDLVLCRALPGSEQDALSYYWVSSNSNVLANDSIHGEVTLSCSQSQWTTLSVHISNSYGSSTDASLYVRCKVITNN